MDNGQQGKNTGGDRVQLQRLTDNDSPPRQQQERPRQDEGPVTPSPSFTSPTLSATSSSPPLATNPSPSALAASSAGSSLSQLERDVLAKSGASNRSSSSDGGTIRPGTVSIMGPGSQSRNTAPVSASAETIGTRPASSLTQLERDIQSKSRPAPGSPRADRSGNTRPGAVAVTHKERSSSSSAAASTSLADLERDVVSKTQASSSSSGYRGSGSSPATTKGPSSQSLSRLERDVLDKSAAARPSGSSASRPGAEMVGRGGGDRRGGNTSLTQLERDVLAKSSRGGTHRDASEQRPGAVSVPHNASGASSSLVPVATSLTQLERDLVAKSQSRPSSARPPPGAAAVATPPDLLKPAPSSSLAAIPSSSASQGSQSAATHGLSQLERDILSKSSATTGGGPAATSPGAVSVRGASTASATDGRGNDLSQFEQDVLAKSSTVRTGSSDRKGVQPSVASTAVSGVGLSQLEQDVLAKSGGKFAKGDAVTSQQHPGAVAVQVSDAIPSGLKQSPPGSSSPCGPGHGPGAELSQLEREALAKGSVSGSVRSDWSERPGVFSVGAGSSVSDLERRVLAKGAASAGVSSGAAVLSQLERDVVAKRSVGYSQASQPGVFAGGSADSSPATSSTLTNLERDVMAKCSASGGSRASYPGAIVSGSVATIKPNGDFIATRAAPIVTTGSTVTQLEQEVLAKASSARAGRATHPGSDGFSLSQLERDVLIKGSASIGTSTELPGAVASSVAGAHGLQKSSMSASSSVTAERTLSRLERDLVAKSATVAECPGGTTSSQGSLSQLEQDVLSKQRSSFDGSSGLCPPASSQTNPLGQGSLSGIEQDVAAKRCSLLTSPMASGIDSLRSLEGDIAAKSGSVQNRRRNDESTALSSIRNLENAVLEKSQVATHPTIGYGEVIDDDPPVIYNDTPYLTDERIGAQYRQDSSIVYGSDSHFDHGDSAEDPVAFQPPTFVADYGGIYTGQEQPIGPHSQDGIHGFDSGAGGIEAFVADNVVDATGVAVIMSEEEEMKMIRKRQNKQFLILGLIVVVLIIVVVVSVVLTVGKADPLPPTMSPTRAPTSSPTMAPTTSTLQDLLDSLRAVTGDSKNLGVPSSPQYRAALWLADDDSFVRDQQLTPLDSKFLQRYALATMYYSLGGDDWDDCGEQSSTCGSDANVKPWLSAYDECEWKYLTCTDGMLVDKASFVATEKFLSKELSPLIGTLPTEMALLTNLRYFEINRFPVEGTLDMKFNCPNLDTLILTKTSLAGSIPDDFFVSNPTLRLVDMSFSWLNGTIPRTLGSLSVLEDLRLNNNNFTGELVEVFTSLTKLTRLTIQENILTGQVPDSLFALSSLQVLRIDDNPLKGYLPSSMQNLQSLRELRVGNSGMGGLLPGDVWTLPSLEILDVGGANFSGTIPEAIIGLNDTVRELLLYNNGFSGRIPDNVAMLDVLEVFLLYGNDFTGTMPPAICGLRGNEDGALFDLRVTCGNVECSCCNPCVPADGSGVI